MHGKVIDFRTRGEIGSIAIPAGAPLFGDNEGVLVINRRVEDGDSIKMANVPGHGRTVASETGRSEVR
jgi:hypothetical protein